MLTSIYASILAIYLCGLSLNVIRLRRKHRVGVGDGGVKELQLAKGAQTNAAEVIPITIILLYFLEMSGANSFLLHGIGTVFLLSRIIHFLSIVKESLIWRVISMQTSFSVIILLGVLNIISAL